MTQLACADGELLIIQERWARGEQDAAVIHRNEVQVGMRQSGSERDISDGLRPGGAGQTRDEPPREVEDVAILAGGKVIDAGCVPPGDHHAVPACQRFTVEHDEAPFIFEEPVRREPYRIDGTERAMLHDASLSDRRARAWWGQQHRGPGQASPHGGRHPALPMSGIAGCLRAPHSTRRPDPGWCSYCASVASDDEFGLGYRMVDAASNVSFLVDTMDVVAGWRATVELRRWEADRLQLSLGERLIDVGCGPGDAALARADDLGATGEIVGIDISEEMLAVACQRARTACCATRFAIGDALALDEPDDSFDAARCERALQWVSEPAVAVAELARVVRPGGRICLIDTDWSTLRLDVGDPDIERQVHGAMRLERARPSNVGSRLGALVEAAGLDLIAQTSATHRWTTWDPAVEPVPPGCFSMRSLGDDMASTGQLAAADVDAFVSTIESSASAGRFRMSLTMFATLAVVPSLRPRRR